MTIFTQVIKDHPKHSPMDFQHVRSKAKVKVNKNVKLISEVITFVLLGLSVQDQC